MYLQLKKMLLPAATLLLFFPAVLRSASCLPSPELPSFQIGYEYPATDPVRATQNSGGDLAVTDHIIIIDIIIG
ncbi:MAG: hypothetical protein ABIQ93_01725 [Saprospiraceae bacterium]